MNYVDSRQFRSQGDRFELRGPRGRLGTVHFHDMQVTHPRAKLRPRSELIRRAYQRIVATRDGWLQCAPHMIQEPLTIHMV